jgi:hypothetical protein
VAITARAATPTTRIAIPMPIPKIVIGPPGGRAATENWLPQGARISLLTSRLRVTRNWPAGS